jgi:hypothetical protein
MKLYGNIFHKSETVIKTIQKRKFKFPSNSVELNKYARKYLEGRNFDPDLLIQKYQIQCTGPVSSLGKLKNKINFRNRILIPIIWNGQVVSFQTRDFTKRHKLKYIVCPEEREIMLHKNILYGNQSKWGDVGIGVEGVTDVWRLGDMSCATFGIKYKSTQVRVIAKQFKRFAVVFDDEPQAVVQAKKLVGDLKFRGVDAFRIPITGDPGDMKESDVKYLLNDVKIKSYGK